MKQTYKGVEIEYDERANDWFYELRGTVRRAPSLAIAKERIDKPAPKDREPFTRTPAFTFSRYSGDDIEEVTVTSIAGHGYGGLDLWISDSKKSRSKVGIKELYADDPGNRAKAAEYRDLKKQEDLLSNKARAVRASMTPFSIPKNVETE